MNGTPTVSTIIPKIYKVRMEVYIEEVSEIFYNELKLPVLFEDKLTNRTFGIISSGKNQYKCGWQSTISKPKVKIINDLWCFIGIDLIFVVFETSTGKVLTKLSLDYFFYDIKIFNGFVYVITELEIIKISTTNLKESERYALTDFFESLDFLLDSIIVKTVDGNIMEL